MFVVIACPRCRRARVTEAGKRTTSCGSCGRELLLADLRIVHQGHGLEEAQHAAGLLNAKLAGRSAEFSQALVPPPPRAARHDDAFDAAAAASRSAHSEADRADAVARALSRALGDFSEHDLTAAFSRAALPRPCFHLERMLKADVLYEPRAGRYQAL